MMKIKIFVSTVIAGLVLSAFTSSTPTDPSWFGARIPASGYDASRPDCGMHSARIFDTPPTGLKQIGTLQIPLARDVPENANVSIGFEGLDRKLFEPGPTYVKLGMAGIKWARVQTMWSLCEREKGVYDFSELDGIVNGLTVQGIRTWFNVGFGNTLYMTNCYTKAAVGCVPLYYGEACKTAWISFVHALARHYKGRVTHWEIWNEPNLRQFWQPHTPDANMYFELVRMTGAAIREEIPDAKIGATSASPSLNKWELAFFAKGGAKLIDFWCGHAYATVPEHLRVSQRRIDGSKVPPFYVDVLKEVRAVINRHGGQHVEIWQGESGFPSWFPENHWLFPKGFCKKGWQSQANQAKWLLRRFITDRRAGLTRSSFYQAADISRHYSMAVTTQKHPAEHGILNGWTYEPKMSYFALGYYNALFACAKADATTPAVLTPAVDGKTQTIAAAFRSSDDKGPFFVYYTPFDFSQSYTGRVHTARNDAALTIRAADAPKDAVLVDLLRGGVYTVPERTISGTNVTFTGLPLTDYPLVLADRNCVPLRKNAP